MKQTIYLHPYNRVWVAKLPKSFKDLLVKTFTGTKDECDEMLGTDKPHPEIEKLKQARKV